MKDLYNKVVGYLKMITKNDVLFFFYGFVVFAICAPVLRFIFGGDMAKTRTMSFIIVLIVTFLKETWAERSQEELKYAPQEIFSMILGGAAGALLNVIVY